jgi:hypothetical protein
MPAPSISSVNPASVLTGLAAKLRPATPTPTPTPAPAPVTSPGGFQWNSYPVQTQASPQGPQDPARPDQTKPKRGKFIGVGLVALVVIAAGAAIVQPNPFVDEQPLLAAQIESAAALVTDASDRLGAALDAANSPTSDVAALPSDSAAAAAVKSALAEMALLQAVAAAVLDPEVTFLYETTQAELRDSWNDVQFADAWTGGYLSDVTRWRITKADGETLLGALNAAVTVVPGLISDVEAALTAAEETAYEQAVDRHEQSVSETNSTIDEAAALLASSAGRVADEATRTTLSTRIEEARSVIAEPVPALSGEVSALNQRISNARANLRTAISAVNSSVTQWEADEAARIAAEEEAARVAAEQAAAEAAAQAQQYSSSSSSGGYVYYENCTAARAAGDTPIYRGEPGYRSALDRDNDGIACE